MYNLEIDKDVCKKFEKLSKKDAQQIEYVNKKIEKILQNPHQFKPLKHPMEMLRRVHVGSFVIIYQIDEKRKTVIVWEYEHHDEAYKK